MPHTTVSSDSSGSSAPYAAPAAAPPRKFDWGWLNRQETVLIFAFIVVLAGVSAINRGFIAPGNLVDIVYNSSYIGVAAIGMTMIILCGHIDISIGAALGVCATVAGKLAVAGTPLWIVFPVTILVGGFIGLLNGILVAYGRIPAIVATLGMASILKGGLILATGGKWIYGLPPGFTAICKIAERLAQAGWFSVCLSMILNSAVLSAACTSSVYRCPSAF